MQLFAILAALVAVNVGLVYVGSESYEGYPDKQPEGVVEVEEVAEQAAQESEPKLAPIQPDSEQPQ